IKLIINIIKKFFKYLFILIVIGGIIGGGVYLWQENENKKERELNLAFFTGVSETFSGDIKAAVRAIDWEVDDYYHYNSTGEYQSGFDGYGKLYYRHVKRNTNPPSVTLYYLDEKDEGDDFSSVTVWMIDCTPDSSTPYLIGENSATIRCSEDGKRLFSYLSHYPDRGIRMYRAEINANGFTTSINPSKFDINKLRQNMTLIKLKNEDS
ncbi:hypothetical protein N9746_08055, partial [Candidatus Thioglobus sp.]|nr:hypothetical protein [Candidatus Thioglobus sp.]